MTIILFFIILAVLILVHETGHFLAAKAIGARVDEFGLGFPPRIFSIKKGETLYSINLIPFGGFVKILGENHDEESNSVENRARSLNFKPRYQQAVVLIAGVFFNWLLAWFVFSGSFMLGLPMSVGNVDYGDKLINVKTTIVQVLPESIASEAGLKIGDEIKYLASSKNLVNDPDVDKFKEFVQGSEGLITIGFVRNNQNEQVSLIAKNNDNNEKIIGVGLDRVGVLKLKISEAITEGFLFTFRLTQEMLSSFKDIIISLTKGNNTEAVLVGPIGLVGLVGNAQELGLVYVLTFMALISVNLAIINLIPFPALDGGRLLFLLIESITRKNIKPNIVNTLNLLGFSVLLILMIAITFFDVLRLL